MSRRRRSPGGSAGPHGFLLVDKPVGPTSHDVVDLARRALGTRRVGHTGTLDPFASGLLVLCAGRATRLARYVTGLDKTYDAVVTLGVTTTTDDPEGEVVERTADLDSVTRERVEAALEGLRGTIQQRPPAYSAKKVDGVPAHRRARRGEAVALAANEVTILRLELVALRLPHVELSVVCSSGTYVRALGRDLGASLGVGAHVSALRRVAVGHLAVAGALSTADLSAGKLPTDALLGPLEALRHLPSVTVAAEEASMARHGGRVPYDGPLPQGAAVALVDDGDLLAVATVDGEALQPRTVVATSA